MSGLTLEQLEEELKTKLNEHEQIASEHNAYAARLNDLKTAFTEKQGEVNQLQILIDRIKGEDK